MKIVSAREFNQDVGKAKRLALAEPVFVPGHEPDPIVLPRSPDGVGHVLSCPVFAVNWTRSRPLSSMEYKSVS